MMPLYYFDVTDDAKASYANEIGTDLLAEDVPGEAVSLLTNIARDRLPDGENRSFGVNVRDSANAVVFKARLTLESGWQNVSTP